MGCLSEPRGPHVRYVNDMQSVRSTKDDVLQICILLHPKQNYLKKNNKNQKEKKIVLYTLHTLLSTTYFVSLNSPRLIIYCIDFYLANKKINIVGFSFWLKEVLGYEALAKFLLEKMVSAMIIHIFSRKSILNFILFFLLIS